MINCKICLKKIHGIQKYADYHNTCLVKLFDGNTVNPNLNFSRKIFTAEESEKYIKRMSISGVQKKLGLKIEASEIVPTSQGGSYILKPTVESYPQLSENEHLSMLIGKALDINTPPLGLLKFNDGELTYVIRRFDWNQDKKILKEDMAQIFKLERNDDGGYKYEKSYEEVALKIREATGGKLTQVLAFFDRIIYNYLIQNGDYHLKNISLQSVKPDRSGHYEGLTPNYDSVMTRLYSKDERDLALALLKDDEGPQAFKSTGFYTRPDFEELGTRIGLNRTVTALIFDRIKKTKSEIDELIDASFLNSENKTKYINNLNSRYKKLGL